MARHPAVRWFEDTRIAIATLTVDDVLRRMEAEDPSAVLLDGLRAWTAENLRRSLEHRHALELSQPCSWDAVGIRLGFNGTGRRWLRYAKADDMGA